MKVLIIDQLCMFTPLAIKLIADGEDVRVWMPSTIGNLPVYDGDGLIPKVKNFHSHMKWADLIILCYNVGRMREITPYFNQKYPIFGCNPEGVKLESDRDLGQKICKAYGIDTIPYEAFKNYKDAIYHIEKTQEIYVCKISGNQDSSLSYVSKSPEGLIWTLNKWQKTMPQFGELILQKKIKGLEIAVGGWFGKSGWLQWKCENFEEKKFMNDGLGCNTGEQGTTIRYVKESKLFDETLKPVTGYLHEIGYVGYVDQNCMVEKNGKVWPLEFTMRFGIPLIYIQTILHKSKGAEWMLDLIQGRDTLNVSEDVAVGVVLSHGTYPQGNGRQEKDCGVPIYGISLSNLKNIHLVSVKMGKAPVKIGNKIKEMPIPCTTGSYIATVTGQGKTVREAQEKAYNIAWSLKPPCDLMFRTDIGKRLKEQLPLLQENGYAEGMKY